MDISLYKPRIDELYFKEKMLQDKETMAYNHAYGGTIDFPQERWESWYTKWIGNNDPHYFYRYISNSKGEWIGEVAYHLDDCNRIMLDVLIYAPYRNQGYGKVALNRLVQEANQNGYYELYDCIAIDNSSIQLFLQTGFRIVEKTKEYFLVKK